MKANPARPRPPKPNALERIVEVLRALHCRSGVGVPRREAVRLWTHDLREAARHQAHVPGIAC